MLPHDSFNALARLRYGPFLYNRNDQTVGRSIEHYGEFSWIETSVFNQLLAPGQVVIDAGAHIGVHTLFFAKKTGPAGRVLAFEPQRLLFQTLCGNMALNSIANTHCWNLALGAEPGETTMPVLDPTSPADFGDFAAGEQRPAGDGETVGVTTIDHLELPRLDFVKIDVGGDEDSVLRGGERTIRRFLPILYLECSRRGREESFVPFLDKLGYQMFWHHPPLFNPHNLNDNPENIFGDAASRNMLCFDKRRAHDLTGFLPVNVSKAA